MPSAKPTNLIVDLSNITHIVRHGRDLKSITKPSPYFAPLLFRETINLIDFLVHHCKADGVLIAVDSKNVWRKDIYPEYKGNRDDLRDVLYEDTKATMKMLSEFFRTCTNIPVVEVPRAEADDVIAVASTAFPVKSVIASSDRDYVQLINEDVRVYSPAQKEYREAENPDYYLFVKCIRGDTGDNIFSAYPRVRETKLEEAYNDPFAMANLMATVTKEKIHVGAAYQNNRRLIDFAFIPDDVRQSIVSEVAKAREPKQFSNIELYRFLGENGLADIAKWMENKNRLFNMGFQPA